MRSIEQALIAAAERLGVQLQRARTIRYHQKNNDLAREAVGWNFHDRKRSLLTRETVNVPTVSQKRRVSWHIL
jgi:precorrin-6B methylase 1